MTYSKDKLREALEKNRPSDFVKREVGEAWDVFPSKFSRVEIGILMDRYAREIIEALLDAPEGEVREGPSDEATYKFSRDYSKLYDLLVSGGEAMGLKDGPGKRHPVLLTLDTCGMPKDYPRSMFERTCEATHLEYLTIAPAPKVGALLVAADALLAKERECRQLIVDELSDLVPLADAHGWKSKRVEAGQKLRDELALLQYKYARAKADASLQGEGSSSLSSLGDPLPLVGSASLDGRFAPSAEPTPETGHLGPPIAAPHMAFAAQTESHDGIDGWCVFATRELAEAQVQVWVARDNDASRYHWRKGDGGSWEYGRFSDDGSEFYAIRWANVFEIEIAQTLDAPPHDADKPAKQ